MSYNDWECVIGLEIHAQMSTKSKIFSSDSTEFGAPENTHISTVSIGLPGSLPVLNKRALELSIRSGLALNCTISKESVFARKNYFYPDLPKGYQISQFDKPLCIDGFVQFYLEGQEYKIQIERAHMEEDAGKSTHLGESTLVDFNRAGIPLLEIVSKPDIRAPEEASAYARAVRDILRYVKTCDGNLEEGSLRCDCNVSVRKKGDGKLGTKVEIKNINSFRFIEKALHYEFSRQVDTLESGGKIIQETRLYDSDKNKTFSMREKEEAHDYRYFPDPDLLPIRLSERDINTFKDEIPELPFDKLKRFVNEYELSPLDASLLTSTIEMASYFEAVSNGCGNPKSAANWITGDLLRDLNENKILIEESPIKAGRLAELIQTIDQGKLSGKMAKQVFVEMFKTGESSQEVVDRLGLKQISGEEEIKKLIQSVVNQYPDQVEQFKSGKTKVMGFFVGQVMKATKGQANPDVVNRLLLEILG